MASGIRSSRFTVEEAIALIYDSECNVIMSCNLLSRGSTQRIICVKFNVLADLMFFAVCWSLVDTLLKSLIVNYLCASYFNGKRNRC